MATSIKLSESIINDARKYGKIYSRSLPKQIEYWANIGKVAEENPDLPFSFIKEIWLAKLEKEEGDVIPYEFG